MFHRGPTIPHGWELAPSTVEQEVFTLWQDEDMPAELKDAPGHVPFAISAESEAWIDSMIEVRELIQGKERHVVGRPRPFAAQPLHRITGGLQPPAPSPPAPPPLAPLPTVTNTRTEPSRAEVWKTEPEPPPMPEIVLGRSLTMRRPPPADAPPPPKSEEPVMPEVGGGGQSRPARKKDEIPTPPAAAPPPRRSEGPLMPEVGGGGQSRPVRKKDEMLMPEIDTS